MSGPKDPRASGMTQADEVVKAEAERIEQEDQGTEQLVDSSPRSIFRTPAFHRMKLSWSGDDAQIIAGVTQAVDERLHLRFMDAYQHTFTLFDTLEQGSKANPAKYDAAFEFRNTFTNIQSVKYPWLNLFTLNFGYHNAHHEKPAEPWHRLPALHARLYGDTCTQILPFTNLLAAYHRYRTQRLLNDDPAELDVLSDRGKTFIGVDGVSFLTGH